MKRIFRFLKALWKYILYGHRVSFVRYSHRIEKCSFCTKLDEEKWTCKVCGCYVTKKTKMDTESCPDGKW